MRSLWSYFRKHFTQGLRGKLILTYTLVTVLALLALEILVLTMVLALYSLTDAGKRGYLSDIVSTLYPQASKYLQPGKEDLPGLQSWLEQVYASGYASEEPGYTFDSPAAAIVPGSTMMVVSPEQEMLARVPAEPARAAGLQDSLPDVAGSEMILRRALEGNFSPLGLVATTPEGDYLVAVPVAQADQSAPVAGAIILTVRPPPPMILQVWPALLGWVVGTGIFLLIAVAPFGALFGLVMSRGLVRRLAALTSAADNWSEGNFTCLPSDRSRDEIGHLGMRMRHMAERIQNLLGSQQQLAMMEERNRLARDLHDTVKQHSFATLMQLRAARNLLDSDPDAARRHLEDAESLIKTTQQDLGLIIAELRPAALEGQGLAGALRSYLDTWSQHTRIPATLQVLDERALPLAVEQAVYRVAQEALSNIARHSSASAVTVRLAYEPCRLTLSVADNGVGFDGEVAGRAGYGLQSMMERLAAVDGRLDVESTPGEGTTVTASITSDK